MDSVKNGSIPEPAPDLAILKQRLLKTIRRSVYVYRIDCGGCNGCEIEIFASITPLFDLERFGIKVVPSPRHADILVFTGPMTRAMRLPAIRAYKAAPDPKLVVAYGACACSGGIFHDSYAVWGGTEKIFPVDLYIPGCPPTPGATVYGFAMALGLLAQKIKGNHYAEDEKCEVRLRYPDVPLEFRKMIEREARRLCGYRYGKRIAERYLEVFSAEDPAGIDQRFIQLLQKEEDERLREVYTTLHRIFQNCKERNLGDGI